MLNEKLKDIIEEVLRKHVKEYQNPEVENNRNKPKKTYGKVFNSPQSAGALLEEGAEGFYQSRPCKVYCGE